MHFSLGGKQKGKKKEKKENSRAVSAEVALVSEANPASLLQPHLADLYPLVQLPPAGVGGEVGAHSQGARPHL